MIEQAEKYAITAKTELPDDIGLQILLSRICMYKENYVQARAYLQQAIQQNAPPSQVFPYLAEIDYNQQNYRGVRANLAYSSALRDIPKLSRLIDFWCDDARRTT